MLNGNLYMSKRWLKIFILASVLFFQLSGAVNFAFADSMGPAYSQIFPADGQTVSQTQLVISLIAKDTDLIDYSSLLMQLDGVTVSPTAQFAPIDESTDDYTTLEIYYPATLATGSHQVYVAVKDKLGNASSYTWTFNVTDPPQILTLSPANGATVVNRAPEISAVVSGEAIDPNSIIMTLNGIQVDAVYDQVYSTIKHTPAQLLVNETFHNVTLDLKDTSGRAVSATWQFYVNTFSEMTYSVDDNTCQKCHDRTTHYMENCARCHGINESATQPVYPVDDCYMCHFGSQDYPTGYHTVGLPPAYPEPHPVQVTYSCTECHNKAWEATVIPSVHNIFNTAINHATTTTGCTDCHSNSLTREHLRRLDEQGNPLTCFTCHNSPDSIVQGAILTGDSSCSACHTTEYLGHNSPPVIEAFSASEGPVPVNSKVEVNASFTDTFTVDSHTASIEWGDGSISFATVTEASGTGSVYDSHYYTAPGVYLLKITVTDGDGGAVNAFYRYVVVYDPAAGFVTGGGWINSPEGAYILDPSLTGKAHFGFVSSYPEGSTVPTGHTEFQFKIGNLNFHSTIYEWLVVNGAEAQYQGLGTINGTGDYGFMISAVDGILEGLGYSDRFRIKIWDKNNGDSIIYDNQLGDDFTADPATALGGGSIVIHKQ